MERSRIYLLAGLVGVQLLIGACRSTTPSTASKPEQPAPAPGTAQGASTGGTVSAALLSSPLPRSTSANRDAPIALQVDLADSAAEADAERAIHVTEKGGAVVRGRYSWKALPFSASRHYMVEFLPNAPLLANTEYRVSAEKYGTFLPDWDMEGRQAAPVNGSYVSGFSTKEGPSVAGIQLISKDGGKSIAYIRVQFSEEVDTQSVKDAIEVQANALTVSGRIPDVLAPKARDINYFFLDPVAGDANLRVEVSPGVRGGVGAAFNPRSFDSQTEDGGAFKAEFSTRQLRGCREAGCWEWVAEVGL